MILQRIKINSDSIPYKYEDMRNIALYSSTDLLIKLFDLLDGKNTNLYKLNDKNITPFEIFRFQDIFENGIDISNYTKNSMLLSYQNHFDKLNDFMGNDIFKIIVIDSDNFELKEKYNKNLTEEKYLIYKYTSMSDGKLNRINFFVISNDIIENDNKEQFVSLIRDIIEHNMNYYIFYKYTNCFVGDIWKLDSASLSSWIQFKVHYYAALFITMDSFYDLKFADFEYLYQLDIDHREFYVENYIIRQVYDFSISLSRNDIDNIDLKLFDLIKEIYNNYNQIISEYHDYYNKKYRYFDFNNEYLEAVRKATEEKYLEEKNINNTDPVED